MQRRIFMLAGVAIALEGCARTAAEIGQAQIAVGKVSGFISEIVNGLNALSLAPSLQTILSSDELGSVETDLVKARNVIEELNASNKIIPLITAQGWVGDLQTAANSIFNVLESSGELPPTAEVVIEAIKVVFPALLIVVQMLVTVGTPTGLTLPQAESLLKKPVV